MVSRDSMRQVPVNRLKSADSTSVKQMSRTLLGGCPMERGVTRRTAGPGLRRGQGRVTSGPCTKGRGAHLFAASCGTAPAAGMPSGSSSMSSVAVALNLMPKARSWAATCNGSGSTSGTEQGAAAGPGPHLLQSDASLPAFEHPVLLQGGHNVCARELR